tara:strand:+ start:415 stop:690 length:276 start_codon:yes stop_codon:yes gene_type:complete
MIVNNKQCRTQTEAVLQHLKMGRPLNQQEATELYGTQRLGAIIYNLRHKVGYDIMSLNCTGKNKFGNSVSFVKYMLMNSKEEQNRIENGNS